MSCAVCLEEYNDNFIELRCHKFCLCTMPWVVNKKTCPLCRNKLTTVKYSHRGQVQMVYFDIQKPTKHNNKVFYLLFACNLLCILLVFRHSIFVALQLILMNQLLIHLFTYIL